MDTYLEANFSQEHSWSSALQYFIFKPKPHDNNFIQMHLCWRSARQSIFNTVFLFKGLSILSVSYLYICWKQQQLCYSLEHSLCFSVEQAHMENPLFIYKLFFFKTSFIIYFLLQDFHIRIFVLSKGSSIFFPIMKTNPLFYLYNIANKLIFLFIFLPLFIRTKIFIRADH